MTDQCMPIHAHTYCIWFGLRLECWTIWLFAAGMWDMRQDGPAVWDLLSSSWLNVLLICVPLGVLHC